MKLIGKVALDVGLIAVVGASITVLIVLLTALEVVYGLGTLLVGAVMLLINKEKGEKILSDYSATPDIKWDDAND